MIVDSYKKLKLEFKGIKKLLYDHAFSDGNINNYLDELEEGLNTNNIEIVLYCLNEICNWYQRNIPDISPFYNLNEHKRNKEFLEEIKEDLVHYDFSEVIQKNNDVKLIDKNKIASTPKIFLSHRSSDKKYGDALEKLIVGLGVENDQLIYTSHPLHKIPFNENIYDYLRKNINQKVFVIILWSNEYLESPACLNEMGAAWVTQSDYSNMYTPEFAFNNSKYHECAVDTRKMGTVLNADTNCRASMVEFRDKILEMFNLKLNEQTWTYLLDQFIIDIQ
jgi:hypothetical protein